MMTTILEDYTPIFTGDTGAKFAPSFQHLDGSPVSLVGMTISMKMQDQDGNLKTCSGTWTVDDAANGLAHYQYQTADVNQAGIWTLYIVLTNGSGQPVHAMTKLLEIKTAP
jgi:hypothetical protein